MLKDLVKEIKDEEKINCLLYIILGKYSILEELIKTEAVDSISSVRLNERNKAYRDCLETIEEIKGKTTTK